MRQERAWEHKRSVLRADGRVDAGNAGA
jgi:hypothetical protein